MPRIKYRSHKFGSGSLDTIRRANQICAEYANQGYDLTLRQLYYQFVARGWLANKQSNYKRLGDIVSNARMAGLIDWNYIVDRTRNLRFLRHWNDPADAVKWVEGQFRIDKWADQENRVEVWIEKDALVGVLQAACTPEDVPYFSCRGYTSDSEAWGASQRIRKYIEDGYKVTILHLGDHDPSGVDMTRDITDRLWLFIATDLYQGGMALEEAKELADTAFEVKRIALNMAQVEEYAPPPNPAKHKDPRFKKYEELHGSESWELDALPPDVLVALIQAEIRNLRDPAIWRASLAREEEQAKLLDQCAKNWDDVAEFLKERSEEE